MTKVAMSAWLKDVLHTIGALVLGAIAGGTAGLALDLLAGSDEPHFTTTFISTGVSLGIAAGIVASIRRELAKDKNGNTTEPNEKRRVSRLVPMWLKDVLHTLGMTILGTLSGCAIGIVFDLLLAVEEPILTLLIGALGSGTGYAVGITSRLRRELCLARASKS